MYINTLSANDTGLLKVQTVNHGSDCTAVTAVANTGYHFTGWSDGVATASRTDTNITANKTVTANFAINQYTLTYSAGTGGTLTGTSPQTVNHGANGTVVTAVANTGYHFIGWSDDVATATRTDTNVTTGMTVTANFAINSVTILTDVDTINVPEGATNTFQVKLSAQPTGDKIVSVSKFSGDGDITVSIGASLTFTTSNWGTYQTVTLAAAEETDAVNGAAVIRCSSAGLVDKDVTANEVDNDTTLTVTNDGNGTTTPSGATVVTKSAATSISATPSTGYHFVNWTVTNGSAAFGNTNSVSTTVTASADATIRANFAINIVTILTDADTINIPEGSTNTFQVKLSAQPTTGKTVTVSRVSGDGDITVSVGSSLTFTTSDWDNFKTVTLSAAEDADTTNGIATIRCSSSGMVDKDVTATELDNDYTLTINNDGNGTTVPSGASVQTKSVAVSVAATPSTGYHFSEWTVTSGAATFGNHLSANTTSTASTDATIRANFVINTYTVTFDLDRKGERTGGGELSQIINHGNAATVPEVSPKPGWTFNRWNNAFNNITSNLTVTAQWEMGPPVIGDPGMQKAMVGVQFTLPLIVESESSTVNSVTVTGLPAGLKFDAKTMAITGVPTAIISKTVTVTAKNDFKTPAVLTFAITVDPLSVWAQGIFNGSCEIADDSGAASMTVTAVGKVTGKLSVSGKTYTFGATSYSRSDENGALWISAEISIDSEELPLTFRVTNPAVGEFPTLSVAEGWFSSETNGEPVVKMYRNIWKDSGMATTLEPYIGYYTAVLPGCVEYGSGYMTITLDKAGAVKTTGKLSDGTALSLGGTLILDEASRRFAVIYTSPVTYKGGRLFGLVEFVIPEDGGHVFLRLLDGIPFHWENRNPLATSVYDNDGFVRDLGLSGGWYDKTGNLYDYYQNKALTVAVDPGAADPVLTVGVNHYMSDWWDFSGISLETVRNRLGVMTSLSAPKANLPVKVTGVWNYSAENTVGLTTGLNRATGIFKGSFKAWFDYAKTHTSKSIAYEGVLTPEREDKEDGVEGRGFFLWADKSSYVNPLGRTVTYPFNWSYDFIIQSGK